MACQWIKTQILSLQYSSGLYQKNRTLENAQLERQIIDYQAKGERLFTTGCMWTLALIFIAIGLTQGPARDENGVLHTDWSSRAYLGYFIVALLAIAPTFKRRTKLNFQDQALIICDLALFILPIRWRRIAFNEIQSIEYQIRKDDENRQKLFVSVRSQDRARLILQRSDEDEFSNYIRQARDLAKRLEVKLVESKIADEKLRNKEFAK